MNLGAGELEAIQWIFQRLDAAAAHEMTQGAMDPATTLALFGLFRDVVRPVHPRFADSLVAPACEDAAQKISAKIIVPQINAETRWAAPAGKPHHTAL